MDSFVLLGIIPGTNLQISFESWLNVVSAITAALATLWIYRHRRLFAATKSKLAQFALARRQKLTARAA